ncbi:MAG: TetR family transcriptional regulator C-terminal domain-containing protein [Daejeonella sp.]|uniref:TetR family transcriptional regulator C-terminal domain-containing protein n=1 Tax=Daejeonella sp. TaxID=2805397 RepID=UPI002735EF82|nr:TetR family transcriptional regulator C-terminal domain-containing protein [Daejeonella sp.]MDP3468985.1 TetR family transcriptional regulator C-terminal domain-containing protein [Daejeonella sp.]
MNNVMYTAEEIQNAYIDYVLTKGIKPASVYVFAKENNLTEEEFYNFYASFEGIEDSIWTELFNKALTEVQNQEIWQQYSSREKTLAFFYAFIELLKSKRSFVLYSLKQSGQSIGTPAILKGVKVLFEGFASGLVEQGVESGELANRRFLTSKYKDALWIQFGVILNFWAKDNSPGFEKTDEAIEKGINVTFDLFGKSPLDSLFDYGKFMMNNGGMKPNVKF